MPCLSAGIQAVDAYTMFVFRKLPLAQAKAAQDLDKFAERVVTQQLATLQSRILEQPEFAQLEPAAKYPNGKVSTLHRALHIIETFRKLSIAIIQQRFANASC